MPKARNLKGERFGLLTAVSPTDKRIDGRVVWHCRCNCGNEIDVVSSYLLSGDTRSCGCLKVETDKNNLRDNYDSASLFLGKEPRKDSTTGYRGVSRYYTRKTKQERYRAWITVNGKRYYKSGFLTAHEAYYQGRVLLEQQHLGKEKSADE